MEIPLDLLIFERRGAGSGTRANDRRSRENIVIFIPAVFAEWTRVKGSGRSVASFVASPPPRTSYCHICILSNAEVFPHKHACYTIARTYSCRNTPTLIKKSPV